MVVPPSQDLTITADFAVAMEAEFDLRYQVLPDRSDLRSDGGGSI